MKAAILKTILGVIFIGLLAIAAYGSFFVWKINQVEKEINVNQTDESSIFRTLKSLGSQDPINLKGSNEDRINILMLGIAGSNKPGKYLTDTIMVASLNPKTNQVALLSIPRDLYINLPSQNFSGKINSVYQFGLRLHPEDPVEAIKPVEEAVKEITALRIDYWVVANFDGFQSAVDAIGGINIMNPRDIYDPTYPGPNYSYDPFTLPKGFQSLDGATALKYARMRHNDPEGDFGRSKRQQQVLQAIKNKVFSTGTLLDVAALNKLLDTLAENVQTDISSGELSDFLRLIQQLDTNNINNAVLDAWNSDSLLKVTHLDLGGVQAFVLIPRVGNWSETQNLAKNIFDRKKIEEERRKIIDENAAVAIINESGNALVLERIQNLLKKNFNYKNVTVIRDPSKKSSEKSMLYDRTNGTKPFTLNEMTTKLPADISYSLEDRYAQLLSDTQADILLIIGKDLIPKYNMAEDSVEDYTNAKDTNAYAEQINSDTSDK